MFGAILKATNSSLKVEKSVTLNVRGELSEW